MEQGKKGRPEERGTEPIESPHISRIVGSKVPTSKDTAARTTNANGNGDIISISRDGASKRRPLHHESSVVLISSLSCPHACDAKRFKPTDIPSNVPAPNRFATSSTESTPVMRNVPPGGTAAKASRGSVPPPPPNIPRPRRMSRRRSSFGSDTLRVATPKRKSRSSSTSSASQEAQPSQQQQPLVPSRSSSFDEMDLQDSQHQPAQPPFGAQSQSCCSWGDDEDYESQPKTPRAPPSTPAPVHRQSTTGSASTSYSDMSHTSISGGSSGMGEGNEEDLSRVLSPTSARYTPELPPAPPSTPASTMVVMNRKVIKDMGLATPLPSSASFVQDVHQLEQRHQLQQELLEDGAVTPAPPKPATHSVSGKALQDDDQKPVAGEAATTAPPTYTQFSSPASNDFADWAVGDRYQMLRMLGQGSYGQVAQALDLFQGRSDAYVAIKRIQSPFDQEVDAIRLFRELYILRRMRGNECIIQLLDVVQPPTEDLEDFHDLYLVFEYVDTDLYKLIMSPQYLSTEHIQTFLYQMLCGLKFVHSANVIHRDLKPANILLNEDCSLKICDFGLARVVDESSVMASSRHDLLDIAEKKADSRTIHISDLPPTVAQSLPERMSLGRQLTKHVVTRWYRAPELILIQPYTTAVDIWSVGCIFAELLGMQSESVPDFEDRTPLFPGGKCYPLSGDADTEERLDQLSVIFGVIGTPSKEEITDLGKANDYIKTLEKLKPKQLENLYPAADPSALDLLRHMLKFNPKHRCTASEALAHEFFKGIRRPEMEISMEIPLESPQFLHAQEVKIDLLKRKTYEEVVWFRDNVDRDVTP